MKKVKIVTKGTKDNKVTLLTGVKFVTFEKNFVSVVCKNSSYYYRNANVLEIEIENNA